MALVLFALNVSRKKTTFDSMEAMDRFVLARGAVGMFITGWPDAELVEPGFRMDGMILPVAVTADDQEVVL